MAEQQQTREYDVMIAGKMYHPFDKELCELRDRSRRLCDRFNRTDDEDENQRVEILQQLLGFYGSNVTVQKTLRLDYGINVFVGDNTYINFDCTILDTCKVTIGKNVLIGPGVSIFTVNHPLKAKERLSLIESGKPVIIGDNCWLGGKVVICPGVTLGKNVVVGAGSVVTKSFGDDVVIAGNPAKVIKEIDNSDFTE